MKRSRHWSHQTVCIILALGVLSGCQSRTQSFEARKAFAIDDAKIKLASSRYEPLRTMGTNILRRLELTTPRTLDTPTIASALFTMAGNGDSGLLIYWTEEHLSVDGVDLMGTHQEKIMNAPIPDNGLRANRMYEDQTFFFGHHFHWKRDTPVWTALEREGEVGTVMVRLSRAGVPVTDWFVPIYFKANATQPERQIDKQDSEE